MQRRLGVSVAATVVAGAVALGAGTAYAGGFGRAVERAPLAMAKHDNSGCNGKFDKHQKPQKLSEFPNYHSKGAESNTTRKDATDSSGDGYYTHSKLCADQPGHRHFDDKSYDTYTGAGRSTSHNSYDTLNGKDRYDYDKYRVNRCIHDNGGSAKGCEQHHGAAKRNNRRYDENLNKVNERNTWTH